MHLKNSKIIVVKIGSALLVDNERKIRKKWLLTFANDIKKLKSKNKKIIPINSYNKKITEDYNELCVKKSFKNVKLDNYKDLKFNKILFPSGKSLSVTIKVFSLNGFP